MKNYIFIFLLLTALTGILGFAGMNFYGIEAVRVFFLIFADLLVISVLGKILFTPTEDDMRLERIKK